MRILPYVLVANLISLPIFWFVRPLLEPIVNLGVGPCEVLIVVFEALIVFLPSRQHVTWKKALSMSFLMNLASFTIGLYLFIGA